jgi:uncharacterized protein (DUF1800 family)
MQLMSIGLHQLNADGSEQLAGGQPIDTYAQADIGGMAKVFTGWSWNCPDWPDNGCFFNGSANGNADANRSFDTMLGYPQYHSTESKIFLGVTIPLQTKGDPDASLKTALDTLYNHPNVGPFIGRQLIQRLVTSNPSPQYVAAVTAAFNGNGSGVRGDMKAVVKAILMNPEARVVSSTSGKVREPVLRLSALLRAFPFKSDSGDYKVGNTDNAATQLGQTPMRSPSVFNFYRPGYVPPNTLAGRAGLTVPEMQITHETTVAGYANYMIYGVMYGFGQHGTDWKAERRDVQIDYAAEIALADNSAALVDRVLLRLLGPAPQAALKAELVAAVNSIVLPALNADASNQAVVDNARKFRVYTAVSLVLVAPEFLVQK